MSFWETLFHPDRAENRQRSEVAQAANILQVGEFQFLQLAYHHWYGQDMPKRLCDTLFREYMLRNRVPSWARHYARQVLMADEQGRIDDQEPHWHRYDEEYVTHVPNGVRLFVLASLLVFGVLTVSVLFSTYVTKAGPQVLPPYFQDEDVSPKRAMDLREG